MAADVTSLCRVYRRISTAYSDAHLVHSSEVGRPAERRVAGQSCAYTQPALQSTSLMDVRGVRNAANVTPLRKQRRRQCRSPFLLWSHPGARDGCGGVAH